MGLHASAFGLASSVVLQKMHNWMEKKMTAQISRENETRIRRTSVVLRLLFPGSVVYSSPAIWSVIFHSCTFRDPLAATTGVRRRCWMMIHSCCSGVSESSLLLLLWLRHLIDWRRNSAHGRVEEYDGNIN